MTSANKRWLSLAVLAIATLLPIYLAGRSGLRPDELFSLAMATGHSLEHPADVANPSLGDFVQPDHASAERGISTLSETRQSAGEPCARGSSRVAVRYESASLLSSALRLDSDFRDERYGASIIFDGMFARLSASCSS